MEGKVLLSLTVEDLITPSERLCKLDDTLVTEWTKVEVPFPDTAVADGFKSNEDVDGRLPLLTDVDEISKTTEELCTLGDKLVAD